MRFRQHPTPPPYLNLRHQRRLLAMVGLLALVLIAMKLASNPKTWGWLFPEEKDQQAQQETPPPDPKEIDFRVRLDEDDPLPPGTFRSRSQPGKTNASDSNPPPEDAIQKTASEEQIEVAVAPEVLSPVRDNTLGIRRDETEAYFSILAKARDVPLSALERAARDDVAFTVLMVDPDHFRGKPITIKGDVKRLLKLPDVENSQGLSSLYEAWILTDDSGSHLYRVVCTAIPEGIPTGETLNKSVKVRVSGYFFKRQGYASQGGMHAAPLILAKRLVWYRLSPNAGKKVEGGLAPYIVTLAVVIAVTLGFSVWRFSISDRTFQEDHLKRITAASADAIDALTNVEAIDETELFRQMSAIDTSSAVDEPNAQAESGESSL